MRGNDLQKFSMNPVSIDITRSRFERSFSHKSTMNAGQLIPFYVDEVLPGDTFSIDTALVARMTTPIFPVMDNAFLDIYYFSVPYRLVWEHWKEFNGENTEGPWAQDIEYEIPQLIAPDIGFKKGTVADYMGIPTNVGGLSVNALPFRAYALIWNEWFRDQNQQTPIAIPKGDSSITAPDVNNGNAFTWTETDLVTNGANGLCPLFVNKYHDYFTSALPEPQKGPAVTIPLGDVAPVYGNGYALGLFTAADKNNNVLAVNTNNVLGVAAKYQDNVAVGSGLTQSNFREVSLNTVGVATDKNRSGLVADLADATAATINSLRLAFQLQKLYEKDARGGTRYTEIIKAHFGVTSPDARQQRPEYLGGKRVPITMQQVLQTSSTDETSPQGNAAAYSLTQDSGSSFTKSFTEHGVVIGLMCLRTQHTYQQGLEKMWSRRRRYDFYDPVFAHIGEQPILNKEIVALNSDSDDEVFGYQEAWADYRYKPSRVSGAFRTQYAQTLDSWHYADFFGTKTAGQVGRGVVPTLSFGFMQEVRSNVDRTLAVQSSTEDQLIFDVYVKNTCVRPMPVYSVPGLIDHF